MIYVPTHGTSSALFITGFWSVPNKRTTSLQKTYEFYGNWMNNTLQLNASLCVFGGPAELDFVRTHREKYDKLMKTSTQYIVYSSFTI